MKHDSRPFDSLFYEYLQYVHFFSVQIKVNVGGTLFNEQKIYNDTTQAMRLNRKDPSDVAYEDHSGLCY